MAKQTADTLAEAVLREIHRFAPTISDDNALLVLGRAASIVRVRAASRRTDRAELERREAAADRAERDARIVNVARLKPKPVPRAPGAPRGKASRYPELKTQMRALQ